MMSHPAAQGIHLTGSTPFENADEHFENVGPRLASYVKSLADGETGEQQNWIVCQLPLVSRVPKLLNAGVWGFPARDPDEPLVPLEDISDMLKDLPVKYDDWALASYERFKELQKSGVIPAHVRFQVCLPTPISVMIVLFYPAYRTTIEPIWEGILLKALRRIQDNIPHEDLLIQWDIVQEMSLLEGAPYKKNNYGLGKESTAWFDSVEEGVLERLVRLTGHVDNDVPMGIHICYGDFMHKHFIDPPTTEKAVLVANALVTRLDRKLDYFQFPIPPDRDDDAYFEPLKEKWGFFKEKGTYAYAGLVHPQDEEGAKRVIQTVQRALGNTGWGVAAECGLGRDAVQDAISVIDICKSIARPWEIE